MDKSWLPILEPHSKLLETIFEKLSNQDFFPQEDLIFRALTLPLEDVKVVILGQDPYPTPGMAEGLAFSVPASVLKLPPSLVNIFQEYQSDLNLKPPSSGHLGSWASNGVLLLNRYLTVRPRTPLSHKGLGWEPVTKEILRACAARKTPVICWGKDALIAATKSGFAANMIFASPHPSPLSAYRGFFGSRPFSQVNKYLERMNREGVDWRLP